MSKLFFNSKLLTCPRKISIYRRNSTQSSAQYCLELIKKYEYENFTCTLLLKGTARSCAIAVRSFNVEVSRVSQQVSQSSIGEMRLKFWEDLVEKCFTKDVKNVPQHPVAVELFKAIRDKALTKRYFKTLIRSRAENLNRKTFTTVEDVENYSEKTISNVYYLLLEGCGVKNINADHAASHLGKAQGIVQQIRSVPLARNIDFIPLPQDLLNKNKVSHENVLRGTKSDKLTECCYEFACRAYHHLQKSRSLMPNVPSECRGALLPATVVENYLDRLQRVQYNVFHPSLQIRSWKLLPTLWFANFKNKY